MYFFVSMEGRRRVMLVILAAIVIVLCDPMVEGSKSLSDLVMDGYPNNINKPVVKIIKVLNIMRNYRTCIQYTNKLGLRGLNLDQLPAGPAPLIYYLGN